MKVRNIEIKTDCCFLKKALLAGLASMMVLGVFTIDSVTVKAAESSTTSQAVPADNFESYYSGFKSAPKNVYFTESTVKISKYETLFAPTVMKVEPSVANTDPDMEGFKFRTGNSQIATVSNGIITAKKEGRTWLYVETPNKLTAKVSVLVTPQKDYSLVSFVETVVKTGLKQTFNVKDYVYPSFVATASNAIRVVKPNQKYTYRIGNSKIAKVTADGIVQALAKGRTWLYVKSESGYENRISLNIVDTQKKATSVTLPNSQIVNIKEKVKLKAVVTPANGKVASWRIGNSKVATINQSGIVTGVSVGNTYAYAKLANGKEVRSLIKVKNPDKLKVSYYDLPYDIYVANDGESLELKTENISLGIDRIIKFDSQKTNAYPILKAKTGNSKVAVVTKIEDATKKYSQISVKAVSTGNTWLYLETADGIQCKVLLKVKKPSLKVFSMPSKITVNKYEKKYLSSDLKIDDYYRFSVKYRTGNSKIAKVDEDGELVAVSEGLTYLYTECKGKTFKTLIAVKDNSNVKSIKLDKSVVNINAKNGISAYIKASYSPSTVSDPRIVYKIGNPKIATISLVGTIMAKGNGNTYIYATAPNGVTTKALLKVTGFEEVKNIKVPSSIDINLNDNTPGNKDYDPFGIECNAAFDTAFANNPENIDVYIGNNSIAEISRISYSTFGIYVNFIAKSQGNTYLYFKMPNGKIVKTLLKVHW